MYAAAALTRRSRLSILLLPGRLLRTQTQSRFSSPAAAGSDGSGGEDAYLEAWQLRQIQPQAVYEAEGRHRRWFYHVDLQGRLYLEELQKKDLTSCLKNDKFLDFFFSQVRRNDTGLHPTYPFVSPCGREMNYILPADMPIVFHDLVELDSGDDGQWELRYAGTLLQPFDPASVRISPRTGRLYHTLAWKKEKKEGTVGRPRYGLLRSHVGLVLMDKIHYDEGEVPLIEWKGRRFPIRPLPTEEEPLWGLPPMAHDLEG